MLFNSQQILNKLNKELSSYQFGENPRELYEPIQYILELGGKRLRPMLTMIAHNFFSEDFEKAIKPSLAIEVFHNFTLMHDDIMDQAPLRRGSKTVHVKWSTNTAILSGDVMLVKAYDLLLDLDEKIFRKGIVLFNKCAAEVCEGQQLDVNFETRDKVSVEQYLEMIKLKTAVLLGLSLEMGGLIAGADEKNMKLLKQLGTNIGLGFQLKDDMLDVYGNQEKFGKKVGGDIIANKKTYLLIQAMERAEGKDLQKLLQFIRAENISADEKIKGVTAIYDNLEIADITEKKIEEYFSSALKNLSQIDADLYKKNILKTYILKLLGRDS